MSEKKFNVSLADVLAFICMAVFVLGLGYLLYEVSQIDSVSCKGETTTTAVVLRTYTEQQGLFNTPHYFLLVEEENAEKTVVKVNRYRYLITEVGDTVQIYRCGQLWSEITFEGEVGER